MPPPNLPALANPSLEGRKKGGTLPPLAPTHVASNGRRTSLLPPPSENPTTFFSPARAPQGIIRPPSRLGMASEPRLNTGTGSQPSALVPKPAKPKPPQLTSLLPALNSETHAHSSHGDDVDALVLDDAHGYTPKAPLKRHAAERCFPPQTKAAWGEQVTDATAKPSRKPSVS